MFPNHINIEQVETLDMVVQIIQVYWPEKKEIVVEKGD